MQHATNVRNGAAALARISMWWAQFRYEGLIERVASILHKYSLPGAALELEIT